MHIVDNFNNNSHFDNTKFVSEPRLHCELLIEGNLVLPLIILEYLEGFSSL